MTDVDLADRDAVWATYPDGAAGGVWCHSPGRAFADVLATAGLSAVEIDQVTGLGVDAAHLVAVGSALPAVSTLPTLAAASGVDADVLADALVQAAGARFYASGSVGGDLLRRWRLARGMTQADLVDCVGRTNPSAASRWEGGAISLNLVMRLTDVDLQLALSIAAAEGLADPAATGPADRWADVGVTRHAAGWPVKLAAGHTGMSVRRWMAVEAATLPPGRVSLEDFTAVGTVVGWSAADLVDAYTRRRCPRPFGQQLATARILADVTGQELADRVGINAKVLRRWESGVHACRDRDRVAAIAAALAVPPGPLLDAASV